MSMWPIDITDLGAVGQEGEWYALSLPNHTVATPTATPAGSEKLNEGTGGVTVFVDPHAPPASIAVAPGALAGTRENMVGLFRSMFGESPALMGITTPKPGTVRFVVRGSLSRQHRESLREKLQEQVPVTLAVEVKDYDDG